MQVIENLTRLVGRVVASRPSPELKEYDVVTFDIERAEPVEGMRDLLAPQPGSRLDIAVRRSLIGSPAVGSRVHFRAKRTVNGVMCEPYPEAGNFKLE